MRKRPPINGLQVKKHHPITAIGWCMVLIITCMAWAGAASAQSIAFFPLLDLSVDTNGVNTPLTEKVRLELLKRGEKLIPAEQIMAFLVRNRIRTLGQLTSYQGSLVRKELGAGLLLQGTVCQLVAGENPVLSLNLQLSRISDEKIIWAITENLCYSDMISLLGLRGPNKLDDLYAPFFASIFSTFPEDVVSNEESLESLNIATVLIQPKYLRGGENVSCKIKMLDLTETESLKPEMFVLIGERKYPLVTDEDNYLQATWPAGQVAGSYPVTLVSSWQSGFSRKGVIGTYSVDVEPAGARLVLIGTERDGGILFSDKLVIIPKLLNPEPISRWEITVTDEDDEDIIIMGASGNIPRSLTWQGKTSLGNMAEPGEYTIKFKVWDRAEHESSSQATVEYMPEPPDIMVDVSSAEGKVVVGLENSVETPLNYWWAKFFAEDGRLIKMAQGIDLPVSIELDISPEPEEKVQCLLSARDILGNQSQQKIANLFELTAGDEGEEEVNVETEWVEEF